MNVFGEIATELNAEQIRTTRYAPNLLQTLERRELAEVGARMRRETGLDYAETKQGDRIAGSYRRMLTLSSGRLALIERARLQPAAVAAT